MNSMSSAIDSVGADNRPRLLMSPRGRPFDQARVRELAQGEGVVVICGRFEGVDQRVIDSRRLEEVSIGDYILSGGEPAALILLDAWLPYFSELSRGVEDVTRTAGWSL